MFEAQDEEEAEIISRHLGKWGDRVIRPTKGDRKSERGERSEGRRERDGQRERFTDRDSRQEARKAFFAGQGDQKKFREKKSFGEGRRNEREDRRPRRDDERPARKFDGPKGGGRPFRGKKD